MKKYLIIQHNPITGFIIIQNHNICLSKFILVYFYTVATSRSMGHTQHLNIDMDNNVCSINLWTYIMRVATLTLMRTY